MARIEYCTIDRAASPERPIRIFLNDVPVAVSQGSPHGLSELAVGYLLAEGLIADRESLVSVREDAFGPAVYVESREAVDASYTPLHRVTSAGCAQSALLRGSAVRDAAPLTGGTVFDPDDLLAQMDELCRKSPRRNTGECVHGCGVGAADSSRLLLVREDIGRHNAMDKLIGQAWLDRIDLADKALFITGRISSEMALKAYRAGCPLLVSRKSATDEAARRASALGLTLVSHCREGGMRVLTHPERIPSR